MGRRVGPSASVASAPTKKQAVKRRLKRLRRDPEAVTVKIHKVNNRIQEERTYPRKADPRQSPG